MSQDANPKQHNGHGHIQPVRGQAVQGVAAPDAEEVMARVDVPDDGGTALRGYDVVSYETGAPVKGDSAHEVFTENVRWGRVRYVFSSAENAAKFKAGHLHDYAPAYGGFCATGAFSGYCSLSRLSERDEGRPTLRDFLSYFFPLPETKHPDPPPSQASPTASSGTRTRRSSRSSTTSSTSSAAPPRKRTSITPRSRPSRPRRRPGTRGRRPPSTSRTRRVLSRAGPHTTAFARCAPFLEDFSRRVSPLIPRFQSPTATPFNSI